MKNLIFVLMLITASLFSSSQTIRKDASGNFIQVKRSVSDSGSNVKTGKTYTTSAGEIFDVWQSKNGKLFVLRTSKKTGNIYKEYLKTN